MFQRGINAKEFGEKLLNTMMYSSSVRADDKAVTVTMKKGSISDDED